MLLSSMSIKSPMLESIFRLYNLISEDVAEPYWPRTWSDQILSNPKFQEFLETLGVSGEIGRPMSGAVGRAYPVGEYIVKFTTDAKEAGAAATIQGHDSDHAADIYAVRRVGSFEHPRDKRNPKVNMYAIVMQRLNTGAGWQFRMAGNAVYKYLDNYSGFIEDPQAVIDTVMAKYIDKKYANDPNVRFTVEQVTMAIYDLQEKTGVLTQDPHGGNVAFKGRKPAFYDFGRSSTNYDNPKTKNARITGL